MPWYNHPILGPENRPARSSWMRRVSEADLQPSVSPGRSLTGSPLADRLVMIRRISSRARNSPGWICRSAAATRCAVRSTTDASDKPTSGRRFSIITSALSRSWSCRTRRSNTWAMSVLGIVGASCCRINKIQQFVSFDFFYPAVGQRHKCACGDQALHHVFVAIIETIGHVFGRCGARTAVSLRH